MIEERKELGVEEEGAGSDGIERGEFYGVIPVYYLFFGLGLSVIQIAHSASI